MFMLVSWFGIILLLLNAADWFRCIRVFHSVFFFFFSSRRRHTRCSRDWSSDVCSSDLAHLRASDLDCRLGTPGLAQAAMADPRTARIAAWIDDVEMHHRFLVLETDPTPSNWGARCIRQADRVLIVARAGDAPVPGATERALLGGGGEGDAAGVATSLVLIHPPGTPL